MNSLINPFELLGLDVHKHINLKEVRKTYHNLSLLTHPDKGGNKTDFIIIHQAYKYVEEQVEQSKDMVPLDELETDFKNFCVENPVEKLPNLLDIRDNAAVFNQKFNNVWDQNIQTTNVNHFAEGYGDLMDRSEVADEQKEDQPDDSTIELANKFTSDVVIYTEPEALPENYGSFQRFDVSSVDNFGNLPEKLYDYKETFTQVEKPITTSVKNKEDLEKLLRERENERDRFQQEILNTVNRTDIAMGYDFLEDLDDDVEEI